MQENRPQPELGGPLVFAALAIAGVLLAMLAVYLGTGLEDGFRDWDLHRLGRRFRRALLWAVPLAAVAGILLRAYYERMLQQSLSGVGMLWSIVRAFVHFPLYGMLALLAVAWGIALALWYWLMLRWRRDASAAAEDAGPVTGSIISRWLGPPVWFISLPFIAMKLPMEDEMELPQTISRRRLLRWLPAVLASLLLFTGAVSEDTGERVNPYWLVAFASYWLADYLMVALRVAPILSARRKLLPA
jgi:hypothetical protein